MKNEHLIGIPVNILGLPGIVTQVGMNEAGYEVVEIAFRPTRRELRTLWASARLVEPTKKDNVVPLKKVTNG